MSGHSHWAGIKYKKGLADAKKSKAFSKITKEITVVAREGGPDLNFNSKLRLAVEKAKSLNMPADNIEKAIKRGTGELEGVKLEQVSFEGYGPGGIAIIIEGITDNKNRALGEIKQILARDGGKLVGEGGVRWMFERKGCITINSEDQSKNKEELELLAIEVGAEDTYWHNSDLDIYTQAENLHQLEQDLKQKGIKMESVDLDWVPKEYLEVSEKDRENCQKLFEALDESDSVQEIYSNLKL